MDWSCRRPTRLNLVRNYRLKNLHSCFSFWLGAFFEEYCYNLITIHWTIHKFISWLNLNFYTWCLRINLLPMCDINECMSSSLCKLFLSHFVFVTDWKKHIVIILYWYAVFSAYVLEYNLYSMKFIVCLRILIHIVHKFMWHSFMNCMFSTKMYAPKYFEFSISIYV